MKLEATNTTKDSQRPFFGAVQDSIRMVEEHSEYFDSTDFNVTNGKIKYKVFNEVTYNTGVDDPESPQRLQILINFSLHIAEEPSGTPIADYQATHEAIYLITFTQGTINWLDMDENDLVVYFSSLFNTAKTRAESALSAMGLKALTLENQDFTKPAEKVINQATKKLSK